VGNRFWNRRKEIDALTDLLDEGANVSIIAPRRIGKTSLMREVGRRIEDRFHCLFIDLQKSHSPADVVAEFGMSTRPFLGLWDRTREVFRGLFGAMKANIDSLGIHELSIKLKDDLSVGWREKGESLFQALSSSEKPVVAFLDEVPILIIRLLMGYDFKVTAERRQTADELLSWLRAMASEHKGKIRLVLTGSVGLEPVLRRAGLSATIADFTPFELHPWDLETAKGCLEALAETYNVQFAEGVIEEMVERLGCSIPHHVQMFFNHAYEDCRRRGKMSCLREDMSRIYETRMLSNRGHAELSHYEERLKVVLGPDMFPLALDLLTEVAVTGKLTEETAGILCGEYEFKGCTQQEALREILGIFEHDGYLRLSKGNYVFLSTLLRDWWKARFAFGYIPVVGRDGRG